MTIAIAYSFVPCCDPTKTILFHSAGVIYTDLPKVVKYIGTLDYEGLVPGQCYTVTQEIVSVGEAILLPAALDSARFTDADTLNGCEDPICEPCPEKSLCFLIVPCTGDAPFYSTSAFLQDYVNQAAQIQLPNLDIVQGYVFESTSCDNAINVTEDLSPYPSLCSSKCYYISNARGVVTYVTYENAIATLHTIEAVQTQPFVRICSNSYPYVNPLVSPDVFIENLGSCVDGCPDVCFELTSCDGSQDPIISNSQTLLPYSYSGQALTLLEFPGCWTVAQTETCDCAVNVTVISSFTDCITCTGQVNYKLTDCDNSSVSVYTSTDLSAYVGQVIKREDCDGCWRVSEINTGIPYDTQIIVLTSFDTCTDCKKEYWQLVDCIGVEDTMYTSEDLSAYEDKIVKHKWCPETCWTVTKAVINPPETTLVFITDEYDTCEECLLTYPVLCSTIVNKRDTETTYEYLEADASSYSSVTLLPNQASDRLCVLRWRFVVTDLDIILTDGECVNNVCPEIKPSYRSIEPGYTTPACSIDSYELIMCKSAEVLYKVVLQERYGISNCCPEEDQDWLLKRQLIELQSMVNPNYTCSPASTCGCGSTTSTNCNCNCN